MSASLSIRIGIEANPRLEVDTINTAEFCRLAESLRSRGRRALEDDIRGLIDVVLLWAETCADLPAADLFPDRRTS